MYLYSTDPQFYTFCLYRFPRIARGSKGLASFGHDCKIVPDGDGLLTFMKIDTVRCKHQF